MYQNNLRYLTYESKMLKLFPNLSQNRRVIAALLPDNYDEKKFFPTIWFLGGFGSNGRDLLNDAGPFRESFAQKLINYQRDGLIPAFIGIFPDGTTDLGGSQYINSSANGPFLDHVCDELVPFVDSKLKSIPQSSGRVVTGHSSGGYGAMMISMLRPGVFDHMIASAADSAFEISQKSSWLTAAIEVRRCGGVDAFLEHFKAQRRKEKISQNQFIANMQLAMASCFSPAPHENNAHCQLPLDLESMNIIPEVWDKWLNHDPSNAVKIHWEKLNRLTYFHLDCGSEDEYGAQFGHRQIKHILEKNKVKFTYSEFKGTHRKTSFRYEERFKLLGDFINRHKMWFEP
ncbi:MAG: alpha/beta hydrolase-fold protein [Oligoflexales bacterium]